ncbi:MAG: hypothetical protein MI757_07300 [Pirellulales bacterium]|nr:hypothetical protein [Pirellulales bacterium]
MALSRQITTAAVLLFVMHAILIAGASNVSLAKPPKAKKKLSFAEVQQIVARHFSAIKGYQPGDLITRGQVADLFKQLELYGWKVADKNAILGQVLAESEFVARSLRTDQGKQFMRQIKGYPEGFDRLDRIARMPQGRGNVSQMIKMPGGYEMIQAMTTTHRGKVLGQRLSNAPQGKDFNKPTGRIYNEAALVARLKVSFANRR